MKIREVVSKIEKRIPLQQAEDFDNVGLLCGSWDRDVSGILICHDALENVVDEAILKTAILLYAFIRLFFRLKIINGKNYIEKAVIKAIENKIAIYAIHTAFDNDFWG